MFIRTDIPIAQQIVQSNHASLEAGLKAGQSNQYSQTSSIILIAIKNEYQLKKAYEQITAQGIPCEIFFEPDSHLGYPPGYTSFATLPVTEDQRPAFRKYRLWQLPDLKMAA